MTNGYHGPERRRDHARRRAVAAMSQDELVRALFTDDLTGLANRRAFDEDERSEGSHYAVVDLEGLKWLNDTHGHDVGDVAIRAAANALAVAVEAGGLEGLDLAAYRIGGDEFVVRLATEGLPGGGAEPLRVLVSGAGDLLARSRPKLGARSGVVAGLRFRWGLGATYPAADQALLLAPRTGERGVQPPGMAVYELLKTA